MSARKAPSATQGRAWIELNLANLRHNVEVLRGLLPPGCDLMPAVKANAYGHGAPVIARALNEMGVKSFCVATAREGVELRRHGISGDVLILGYTHPTEVPLLRRYDLIQTVVDYPYGQLLNSGGETLRVHLGIDTGMRRLGEPCENLSNILALCQMEHLRVEGLFTHLCISDSHCPSHKAFTLEQGAAFRRVVERLRGRGLACPHTHLLSSYGLLNYPELGGDYARVGISLYGVFSAREDARRYDIDLRPVLSLHARVAAVKTMLPGERAGYGLDFRAEERTKLAVLTVGYGDGLPRALSCGVGGVLINGRLAPIVGRICMDQTLVDVTSIPHVQPGTVATLIGQQGERQISVCDIAEQAHTISNEILSRLGPRLDRMPQPDAQASAAAWGQGAPAAIPAGTG